MNLIKQIEKEAREELAAEERRLMVDLAKDRIRAQQGRPWYVRFFPFRIRIERL